jgi:hypothetical protein
MDLTPNLRASFLKYMLELEHLTPSVAKTYRHRVLACLVRMENYADSDGLTTYLGGLGLNTVRMTCVGWRHFRRFAQRFPEWNICGEPTVEAIEAAKKKLIAEMDLELIKLIGALAKEINAPITGVAAARFDSMVAFEKSRQGLIVPHAGSAIPGGKFFHEFTPKAKVLFEKIRARKGGATSGVICPLTKSMLKLALEAAA